MALVIRLAALRDTSAVVALVTAAYAGYVPRMGRKPRPMGYDYAHLIRDGRVHVIEEDVSGEEPAVRGLLMLVPEGVTMLVDNVAVHPDATGRGLGRRLLAFADEKAEAAGCGDIRLYTNAAMTENIAFYARLGYVETGRTEEGAYRTVHM